MIVGIGTDIVKIDRIKKAVEKDAFKNRCYTRQEIASASISVESLAGNFAAKEAVSKALGTGFSCFGLLDIEILHNERGKPYVSLHRGAKKIADELGVCNVHLSISHEKEYAIAFAVAES